MSWLQTSNNLYQEVVNKTGSSISAWSFVYSSGYDSTENIPKISVISNYETTPLGIVRNSSISNNEINHILIKGVIDYNTNSYNLYDKVYCDSSGQLVFTPTPLYVGMVIEKSISGKIFIDVNYIFTSQINNVLSIDGSNAIINNASIGSFNYINLSNTVGITGIANGFIGRIIAVHNTSNTNVYLFNNSSSSLSANRLYLPEDEVVIEYDQIFKFIYNGSNWKLIGGEYYQDANNVIVSVNKDGTSFSLGTPVYIDTSGEIQSAIVNTQSYLPARGLIYSLSTQSYTTKIIISGKITLTTSQWNAVTGGSGGLETGKVYYVSSSEAGKITTNKPYIGNSVLMALSNTTALVQIGVVASESIPSMFESWLFR
jgi:hypothetical protein